MNVLWDMRDSGVAADTVTYNAVLQAVGRSARASVHREAARLLAAMAPAGVSRDIHSYNAALLARTHRGDVAGAREVVAAALREGLAPTLTTFNTLLTVYARALHPVALAAAARGAEGGASAMAARQEGGELLALDAAGALSSPERVVAGLPPFLQKDSPKSRLVNTLDTKGTVDKLLADYFGVPVEDEVFAALENAESDAGARATFEPPLGDYSLPVRSHDFLGAADALVSAGLVDPGLVEDIIEEHSRAPSWDEGRSGGARRGCRRATPSAWRRWRSRWWPLRARRRTRWRRRRSRARAPTRRHRAASPTWRSLWRGGGARGAAPRRPPSPQGPAAPRRRKPRCRPPRALSWTRKTRAGGCPCASTWRRWRRR